MTEDADTSSASFSVCFRLVSLLSPLFTGTPACACHPCLLALDFFFKL